MPTCPILVPSDSDDKPLGYLHVCLYCQLNGELIGALLITKVPPQSQVYRVNSTFCSPDLLLSRDRSRNTLAIPGSHLTLKAQPLNLLTPGSLCQQLSRPIELVYILCYSNRCSLVAMLRSSFPRSPVLSRIDSRSLSRSKSSRAAFSCSAVRRDYDDTIQNLKIGKHTRVIFQGFTGRQATANAKESIAWGTNIVGGVRPGKEGEHLGLPVLPSVRAAKEQLKPDATGIYVAAHQAAGAIEEAIEAEIPLIVAVAEHIPLHEILRVTKFNNLASLHF